MLKRKFWKKNRQLIVLLFLVVVLPVAALLAQNKQDTRNMAAGSCAEICPHPRDKSLLYTCNPPDSDGTADIKGCGHGVSMCGGACYQCTSAATGWIKQSDLSKCAVASLAPTLEPTLTSAPTDIPTAIPTVAPTVTPVPTDITSTFPYLKFKISFQGVKQSAECADGNKTPLTITARSSDGVSRTYSGVYPTKLDSTTGDGLAVYGVGLRLEGFSAKDKIMLLVKGPKQLQTKYAIDDQTSMYNKAGGELSGLTGDVWTSPTFDFTGYPLLTGDVSGSTDGVQDGIINAQDFSFIKNEATKRTKVAAHETLLSDLNGNCEMESADLALMMMSLVSKQGQSY